MRERLAILISGGGTTMEAVVKACQSGKVPMDVACIISSDPTAGGIEKARKLQIPARDVSIVDPNNFKGLDGKIDREVFGYSLLRELQRRSVTVVVQEGWMPLTPEQVINEYKDAIFNQHPDPLPDFGGPGMYGKRVHAARLGFVRETQRDFWTEAIAQRVAKDFDKGAVVESARVDILPQDAVDDLQQRVLPVEHALQIKLLQDVAKGNIKEQKERTTLVRPGEEQILFDAKKEGIRLYPHG